MTRSSLVRRGCLSAMLVCAAACGRGDGASKVSLAAKDSSERAMQEAHSLLGPDAKAALDSGNALFRKKAYPEALAQYRLASDRAPQHSAPLFGIYMVARATNNGALADSALAGIRQRNGPLPTTQGGAPHGTMTDSALKQGHAGLKKDAKTG